MISDQPGGQQRSEYQPGAVRLLPPELVGQLSSLWKKHRPSVLLWVQDQQTWGGQER